MMKLRWGIVVALLLTTNAVHAEEVRFGWARAPGTESCADIETLRHAVSERLGHDPFRADAARFLEGIVERQEVPQNAAPQANGTAARAAWVARIFLRDGAGQMLGERLLRSEAPDCASLTDAVVLALALAIDPEAAMRAEEPAPPPTPAPQAAPPPVPENASLLSLPPLEQDPVEESPNHLDTLAVQGIVSHGLLPQSSVGVSLDAGGPIVERFRWAFGLRYQPNVRTTTPDDSFAFGLTSLYARVCTSIFANEEMELAGCGSLYLGAMNAIVYRLVPLTPGERFWSAARVDFRFGVHVAGPLWANVAIGGLVPLLRYRFLVDGRAEQAFREDAFTPEAELGFFLRFP